MFLARNAWQCTMGYCKLSINRPAHIPCVFCAGCERTSMSIESGIRHQRSRVTNRCGGRRTMFQRLGHRMHQDVSSSIQLSLRGWLQVDLMQLRNYNGNNSSLCQLYIPGVTITWKSMARSIKALHCSGLLACFFYIACVV